MRISILSALLFPFVLYSCTQEKMIAPENDSDLNNQGPRIVHSSEVALSNVVYVKFNDEYHEIVENTIAEAKSRGSLSRSGITSLDDFMDEIHATSLKRMFPVNKFEERKQKYGLHLWYEIKFDSSIKMSVVENRLKKINALSVVEFSVPVKCSDDYRMVTFNPNFHSRTDNKTFITNDEYSSMQWSLYNDGTLFDKCKSGADINIKSAWQKSTGSKDVIVAVIDQGVQWKHPELKNNMWVNEAELNGQPGIDDDGNGYVDDIYGYDFVYDTGEIAAGQHGTHVAGTIAAEINNGVGIAGIAGGTGVGDGVRIMTCPILPPDGSGSSAIAAKAAVYAADNGAVISQNSWGYENPSIDWAHQAEFSVERNAYQYFIDNAGQNEQENATLNGGLVVFSAGNSGHQYGDILSWPAAYPDFISVTSIGADYNPAYYTNHGKWADVIAPGGDMVFVTTANEYGGILSTCIGANPEEYTYAFMQGTSMACPHVSGIAALAVSYAKENNYTLNVSELRDAILGGTRNIENYFTGVKEDDGLYTEVKFSINMDDYRGKMGAGLIDASMVLGNIDAIMGKPSDHIIPANVEGLELSENSPSSLTIKWKVGMDYKSGRIPVYNVYYSTDKITLNNRNEIAGENIYGPIVVHTGDSNIGDFLSCTIENLQPSKKYSVGIVAVDEWRQHSEISQEVFQTQERQPGKPVEDLKTTNVAMTSISISWIESSDCLEEPYIAYHAFCSDNQDFTNPIRQVVISKGIGRKLDATFDNLTPSTKYYIKVVGFDKEEVMSEEAIITSETLTNSAPQITAESDTRFDMQYWESKSLSFRVHDPEGEKWTAKLIDETGLWQMQNTDNSIVVSINGPLSIFGEHVLKIEVTDASGVKAEVQIDYNVIPNVKPVVLKSLENYEFNKLGEIVVLDLDEYFEDDNNEELTYTCEVSGDAAKAVITGNELTVTSLVNGVASIKVRATDGKGEFAESIFNVNVNIPNASSEASFYPNPVVDIMNIRIGNAGNGEVNVRLFNVMGRLVFDNKVKVENSVAKVNLSSLSSGTYIVNAEFNGEIYKGNIIKR